MNRRSALQVFAIAPLALAFPTPAIAEPKYKRLSTPPKITKQLIIIRLDPSIGGDYEWTKLGDYEMGKKSRLVPMVEEAVERAVLRYPPDLTKPVVFELVDIYGRPWMADVNAERTGTPGTVESSTGLHLDKEGVRRFFVGKQYLLAQRAVDLRRYPIRKVAPERIKDLARVYIYYDVAQ